MVGRIEPEERIRQRVQEGEDRPRGDCVAPFVHARSPPALEVVRSGIRPVVGVEASMLDMWCQDEETQTDKRYSCERYLRTSTKGPGHRVVSAAAAKDCFPRISGAEG